MPPGFKLRLPGWTLFWALGASCSCRVSVSLGAWALVSWGRSLGLLWAMFPGSCGEPSGSPEVALKIYGVFRGPWRSRRPRGDFRRAQRGLSLRCSQVGLAERLEKPMARLGTRKGWWRGGQPCVVTADQARTMGLAPIRNNITYRGGEPQFPGALGRAKDHCRDPENNREGRGGPGNDRKSWGDPKRPGEGLRGSRRTRRLQEDSRETDESLKASSTPVRPRAKGDCGQNKADWRVFESTVAPPVVDLGDWSFSWIQLRRRVCLLGP